MPELAAVVARADGSAALATLAASLASRDLQGRLIEPVLQAIEGLLVLIDFALELSEVRRDLVDLVDLGLECGELRL